MIQSVVAILGWLEYVGILVILLVMLGAKHIPELLRGMRHGMHEFIRATRQLDQDVARVWETEPGQDDEPVGRYGFKFWFIVALGVAAICSAALALRELLP